MVAQKSKLRFHTSMASSILHHCGYEGLLCFAELTTYKRFMGDKYVNFESLGKARLTTDKTRFLKIIEKLVEMKLVNKMGDNYTVRRKFKEWKEWASENTKESLTLGGFIDLKLCPLYKSKSREDLRELIYLSVITSTVKSKSISRGFIQKLTGLSKQCQRKIEKKFPDLVSIESNYVAVDRDEKSFFSQPSYAGNINGKYMHCGKTSKRGNCRVVQTGNALKLKNENLKLFESVKTKNYNKKPSILNNILTRECEVQSLDHIDLLVDISKDAINGPKVATAKSNINFRNVQLKKTFVIDELGNVKNIRHTFNQ